MTMSALASKFDIQDWPADTSRVPQVSPEAAAGCDEPTDDELIERLRAGEADFVIRTLQDRYGRRVQHFVRGLVRDPWLTTEVTHEVFEKVFLRNDGYTLGTNFRAWIFEIARNQALTALRNARRRPRPISSLHLDEGRDDPLASLVEHRDQSAVEEEELMGAFRRAVEELPEHYRTVFNLCVRDGVSYQEASQQLGLPAGTVGIRIMRARKRLFAELGRHLGRLRRPPACFAEGHRDRA
ncbi:MAG: RNA polymerase sigma factor [Planctomycetota bacterium]